MKIESRFCNQFNVEKNTSKSLLDILIKGGQGSGNFGHGGRPGAIGGSTIGTRGSKQPISDADKSLEDTLKQHVKMIEQNYPSSGLKYKGGYDAVLKEGRFFSPSKLPEGIIPGAKKDCFRNAALLAISNPQYTYVEGFATIKQFSGLPFAHAWCIDKKGNVVDPTWDDNTGNSYMGIPFSTVSLTKTLIKTKYYGMIPEIPSKKYDPLKDGFPEGAIVK